MELIVTNQNLVSVSYVLESICELSTDELLWTWNKYLLLLRMCQLVNKKWVHICRPTYSKTGYYSSLVSQNHTILSAHSLQSTTCANPDRQSNK